MPFIEKRYPFHIINKTLAPSGMNIEFKGAFVWDKSGIRIIGIMRVSVCLGAILIPELRHYIPRQLLLSIYHTLITPYLAYGISAWGYCAKTHLNRLLILQKRALRLIFFCRSREHAIPLFIKSNCLPISFLFFQQLCYLMYDIHTQVAPINLINQFTKNKKQCITITRDGPQMSALL